MMEHTPAQKKQGTILQFNLRMCIKIQVLAKKQFIPHSYHILTFCDLLPNRRTAIWNLSVLYNKELK